MSRAEFGITPLRGYRKWDIRGGRLVSCYKITGLTKVFGIYQTVDQAIAASK